MGTLDYIDIDEHRPEFWAFLIVFVVITIESIARAAPIGESILGGLIMGAIVAFIINIGRKRLQR